MQFITNGPDIPEALLRAHEEGRVVFFCGAGISYPAGLPLFKGLVDKLHQHVGEAPDVAEANAIGQDQFDRAIGHFESRIQGGRAAVRRHLPQILTPELTRFRALTTHHALLILGRTKEKHLRLVTTNFDTLFEQTQARSKLLPFGIYPEPPARSNWNGLVYLHGRLPENQDQDALDRLVLSDGDFGRAYLTEAWAARFVTGLFRDYTLCFVGYSIDDPVLRYMTAAHALGDQAREMYAFAGFKNPADPDQLRPWEEKHVTPIAYNDMQSHAKLHKTLQVWASLYQDGVRGMERVVSRLASWHPKRPKPGNNFVGRMLWALTDKSGLPAKCFAEFNPVPPIEWLHEFTECRFGKHDFAKFGLEPSSKREHNLKFSLLFRPAPHYLSSWLTLVMQENTPSAWDAIMYHLAQWLLRHLNDPTLIIWFAEKGGKLHGSLVQHIETRLNEITILQKEGNIPELTKIRTASPNAVPSAKMQTLWRMLLAGRIAGNQHLDGYRWLDQLKQDGLTITLRFKLRELLAPKITLESPFQWAFQNGIEKDLPIYKFVLSFRHARSVFLTAHTIEAEYWRAALPLLLNDFQNLLLDALYLINELGEPDVSEHHLPSIAPHWQNNSFCEWVTLIELLRDAWLATKMKDPMRAEQIAQDWFNLPYAVFRRLALFAASQDHCIPAEKWLEWLLSNNSWWLWSHETKRETMRLLVLQTKNLSAVAKTRLETAILAGPPRAMFADTIPVARWNQITANFTWLRLAKFNSGGNNLDDTAAKKYIEITGDNPEWKLSDDESDEFSFWSSKIEPYDSSSETDVIPHKRLVLVQQIKQQVGQYPSLLTPEIWAKACRHRFYHCLFALCDLSKESLWPEEYWKIALQIWREEIFARRAWRFAAGLIQSMPGNVFQKLTDEIGWWLYSISQTIAPKGLPITLLCSKLINAQYNSTDVDSINSVAQAPHPINFATDVLLRTWFPTLQNSSAGIPAAIEPIFTQLSNVDNELFRHGRILLTLHLPIFLKIDPDWTRKHLLPLLDWSHNHDEAKITWKNLLSKHAIYPPLFILLKKSLLETVNYCDVLGQDCKFLAELLGHMALDRIDGYTANDFQVAFGKLPVEGLEMAVTVMIRKIERTGMKKGEYWNNHIQPFWQKVWPKSRHINSRSISESLAQLCITAADEFPAALETMRNWLDKVENSDMIVSRLHESGLCKRFAPDSLQFLHATRTEQSWPPAKFRQCLDEIAETEPALCNESQYKELDDYARQRNC